MTQEALTEEDSTQHDVDVPKPDGGLEEALMPMCAPFEMLFSFACVECSS